MGNGKSVPLDTDPRCETLAPIWGPFVDAFVDTLHAKGEPFIRLRLANSGAEDPEDVVPPTATRMTRQNDWRRRTPFDRRARRVRCFVQPLRGWSPSGTCTAI